MTNIIGLQTRLIMSERYIVKHILAIQDLNKNNVRELNEEEILLVSECASIDALIPANTMALFRGKILDDVVQGVKDQHLSHIEKTWIGAFLFGEISRLKIDRYISCGLFLFILNVSKTRADVSIYLYSVRKYLLTNNRCKEITFGVSLCEFLRLMKQKMPTSQSISFLWSNQKAFKHPVIFSEEKYNESNVNIIEQLDFSLMG